MRRKVAPRSGSSHIGLVRHSGSGQPASGALEFVQHQATARQSMRVFPLSNWTEMDVWEYIRVEDCSGLALYFARERLVVDRNDCYHGRWTMTDCHFFRRATKVRACSVPYIGMLPIDPQFAQALARSTTLSPKCAFPTPQNGKVG